MQLHQRTLMVHLTSLVEKGTEAFNDYNTSKLKIVLSLLNKTDNQFLAQHVDIVTRLMLSSENQEDCAEVLGDAFSVLSKAMALPHARTRYLEMDPQLTCFKRRLHFSGSADDDDPDDYDLAELSNMIATITFSHLRHFSYAELAPLRATIVQVANDKSRGDGHEATKVRTKAREMLVGFDYAGPSSSGPAGGDVTLD